MCVCVYNEVKCVHVRMYCVYVDGACSMYCVYVDGACTLSV